MKNYGHFNDEGNEYIITDKDIPRKWDNYIWNHNFFCKVNHDGTGQSFFKHKTALRTELNKGKRCIYLKNRQNEKCFMLPGNDKKEEVVHGLGYSIFRTEDELIKASFRINVPREMNGEAWKISLTNKTSKEVQYSVFTYISLDLSGYFTPFVIQNIKTSLEQRLNTLLYKNNDAYCPTTHFNCFLAADTKVSGFDTVGELFFGTIRDAQHPNAVAKGRCTDTMYAGGAGDYLIGDVIGVLQFDIVLKAQETKDIQVIIGIFEQNEEVEAAVEKYLIPGGLDKELKSYSEETKAYMSKVSVDTPDKELDRLMNSWIKQNLRFTSRWTRIYSRGFRDVLQDTMGVTSLDATTARENIFTALSHIYKNGKCKRAWDIAAPTLSDELYADGPIWIPLTINEYIKETGDTEILQEECPYLDGGSGTILEHMMTAIRFLANDIGEHGLCHIHDGDWTDTAHLVGKKGIGEGVWLSIALYNGLIEISELSDFIGNIELKKEVLDMASEVKKKVDLYGWDGEWFLLAYNDEGEKVGSKENQGGNTYLNPQSWAVISGITSEDREKQCFKVIDEFLDSGVGPLLLTPPYTMVDRGIGTITSNAAGTIENGSCYCHAASFKIVADCKRGRGNKAYETLRKIMPGGDADITNPLADCPPYAFTNSRFATFHPYLGGRCMQTWMTGTISWCWQAFTEWILGIRRTFYGLTINPAIPEKWDGYKAVRVFRSSTYNIEVQNPNHVQSGVKEIYVDAELLKGKYLPLGENKVFNVKVIM